MAIKSFDDAYKVRLCLGDVSVETMSSVKIARASTPIFTLRQARVRAGLRNARASLD